MVILLNIPVDILPDVFVTWFTLYEIIRLDCAFSILPAGNPIPAMLAGKAFALPGNAVLADRSSPNLVTWLRLRRVFVNRIGFRNVDHGLTLQTIQLLVGLVQALYQSVLSVEITTYVN